MNTWQILKSYIFYFTFQNKDQQWDFKNVTFSTLEEEVGNDFSTFI